MTRNGLIYFDQDQDVSEKSLNPAKSKITLQNNEKTTLLFKKPSKLSCVLKTILKSNDFVNFVFQNYLFKKLPTS